MAEGADLSDIHLRVGEVDDSELLPLEQRAAITQFRVFSRVRPFIQEEKEKIKRCKEPPGNEMRSVVEVKGDSTFPLNPKNDWKQSHEFVFDRSLWSVPPDPELKVTFPENKHTSYVTQEDMYEIATRDDSGVSMVDNAFLGINSCILTYGQTSSGKTYTMMGNYGNDAPPSERGIIPRLCAELFQKVDERRAMEAKKPNPEDRWELFVDVTFVEIYKEKVRDLLDPTIRHRAQKAAAQGKSYGRIEAGDIASGLALMKEAKVRRDPSTGPYVEGIEHIRVKSWQDCVKVLERGSAHRTTAATLVHQQSSRSHAIFTVTLVQRKLISRDRTGDQYKTKAGRINLVDLAGSERGGGTDYVQESSAINLSLMALRRVIDNLADRQEKIFERQAAELEGRPVPKTQLPHVPYNDSVLTQLLQDSIGGNAKTVMVATLTPYWEFYDETLRTLEWSQKAKRLVTVVRTNINETGMVKNALRDQLGRMQGNLDTQLQNVDSLKEELNRRMQLIQSLEDKNQKTRQKIDSLDQRYKEARNSKAATFIQLMMYINMFRMLKARRKKNVADAMAAAENARKERDELQEKHAMLQDQLHKHNITLGRIRKKADAAAEAAEEVSSGGVSQRQPEELRKELEEKQKYIRQKRDELQAIEDEQTKTEELLQCFQKEREHDARRRAEERQNINKEAAKMQAALLAEIIGDDRGESALAKQLLEPIQLADKNIPLFTRGVDGNWKPSRELEEEVAAITEEKDEADARYEKAMKEKKAQEDTRDKLEDELKKKKRDLATLNAEISELEKQIIAEKQKGCCG